MHLTRNDNPPSTLRNGVRINRKLTTKCWVGFIDWLDRSRARTSRMSAMSYSSVVSGPGMGITVLIPCSSGGVPSREFVFCAPSICQFPSRFPATIVINPNRGGRGVPSWFLSPVISLGLQSVHPTIERDLCRAAVLLRFGY